MNNRRFTFQIHATVLCIAIGFVCMHYKANGQTQSSTLNDKDGNIYTIKIFPNSNIWMTDNLNINLPGSYCYQNAEQYCKQFGHLYTWKSAQDGCKLLGSGWRLPTDEEWQQLAKLYGGIDDDSQDSGRSAYKALSYGGISGFNILLGGGRDADDNKFARLNAHGFYWTATSIDTANAWYYNFGKGSGMLFRQDGGDKLRAFSVRCIRDTGKAKNFH